MKRLRWYATRALEHLGWAGVVGTLLLLCAGGYLVSYAWEAQQLRPPPEAQSARSASSVSSHDSDARSELEELEKTLKVASLEENLQAMHDAGRAAGLELKRLEYRMAEDKRWRLKQYQIVAPVTSTYPRVREFIALALAKVPALALDHVSFQKRKVGEATIDAELRFTLFIPDAP